VREGAHTGVSDIRDAVLAEVVAHGAVLTGHVILETRVFGSVINGLGGTLVLVISLSVEVTTQATQATTEGR
jgi:hypothetical protein